MGKKALVLSGGSIKGAFQTGAIKQILDEGFKPDIIHGISVGTLNGSFLVNETGRLNNEYEWTDLGNNLKSFWEKNVTQPSSLIEERKKIKLVWQIFRKKFKGIVSTAPLKRLIKSTITIENLINSQVDFTAGAVDLVSGKIKYFDKQDHNFIEGIIASTAIPIIMPLSNIGGTPYYDGGLRDIAPLKGVIEKGADEIIIILCQSADLANQNFNSGNLLHLISQIMDIVSNEIVNNDVEKMKTINELISERGEEITEGVLAGKRKIKFKIIRPQSELVIQIDDFNSKDIKEMISLGQLTAKETPWVM